MNRVLKEVIENLETSIKDTNGTVEISQLPMIDGDPSQLCRLFQNLVSNALKFHKPQQAPEVKVYVNNNPDNKVSNQCSIVVEDNGIGFDEKYLDIIFTIFKRLHGRGTYEGTGIGLAICRRIVNRHGGSITAESAAEEGAKFIVNLPVKQIKEDNSGKF